LRVIVAGGGPAGLTAAYELSKRGAKAVVYEVEQSVGGISKTVEYRGYKFDLGGHRFFTKIAAVRRIWEDVMGDGFMVRPRLSRIYYKGKFYNYPLKIGNVFLNLGVFESLRIFLSFLKAKAAPYPREDSFEEYVVNRFGRRLYETFFKSYTEKVWGMPCASIGSGWAAQRIRGMSFTSVLKTAVFGNRGGIRSLIEEFHYPREGPGQLWEAVAQKVRASGSEVVLGAEVVGVDITGGRFRSATVRRGGASEKVEGDAFVSTMPLRDLVSAMKPKPPRGVLEAAVRLKYRDFITVSLIVAKADLWPDNWIYIHDGNFRVGRIQNYKNWSPYMVPDPSKTCVGMEYFAFEGDDLWVMDDASLVAMAGKELASLGLIGDERLVEDGTVVRVRKAYPVYDMSYAESLETVRAFLGGVGGLYSIGRNGMHRYNNQDHSMLSAILAVENLFGAENDVWSVNAEQEYHEAARAG
jgi:protoporphyrinogen oxidase